MHLAYEDYLGECFSRPVLALLWILPFLLAFLIALAAYVRSCLHARRFRLRPGFLALLCLAAVIGFPLNRQPGVLRRTDGVAVLQDRNTAPLTLSGVIASVDKSERSAAPRFTYGGKHHYGVWLTFGNQKCYAVTSGGFSAGDSVIFEYLPKSRCVLCLAPADFPQEE